MEVRSCSILQAFSSSLGTSAMRADRPAFSCSRARFTRLRVLADSLSPWRARFSRLSLRFSRLSRSASISSVSMISRSARGSMRPST